MRINWQKSVFMAGLILAGETIYLLPYLRRTFQTSMEVSYTLTATEVGWLNTAFGVMAFLSYWPGGWLADKFPARKLLIFSLVATSAGGFLLLAKPGFQSLLLIHAFWGLSAVLPFWAALIKATRQWGDADSQGRSFGALDAGRGAIAALSTTAAAMLFAGGANAAEGLQRVVILYSALPLAAAGILGLCVRPEAFERNPHPTATPLLPALRESMTSGRVLLLAGIVFASYFLYLGTFDFPTYVEKVRGSTKVFGAQLGAARDWMRPLAALTAGLLADRYSSSKVIGVAFTLLVVSFGSLFLFTEGPSVGLLVWIQMLTAATAVFALRGIYFALVEEVGIPLSRTGFAVGAISLIGFSPDIFVHLLSGSLIDQLGVKAGYHWLFAIYTCMAVIGLLLSLLIHRMKTEEFGR